MSTLEPRSAIFDAESVTVNLTAREKAFRLFTVPQLIERVAECDGALFRDHDKQNYHLKSDAPADVGGEWIIVFAVDRDPPGIGVITQMHDHIESYGAEQFEHIQDAKRYFADRAPDNVLDGDGR